jgi:YggT family protein
MSTLLSAADTFIALIRALFVVLAILLGIVCVIDWAVRTRKISPFNRLARFFRSSIDPLIAPVERRVVRAGGLPSSAPFWALAAVVIGGLVILSLLEFLRSQMMTAELLLNSGPAGILRLFITAVFSFVRIAIIVSVIASWLPISPFSPWVRWSHRVSEPVLRPVRRFIPSLGGLDLSPLVAYFIIGLIESALLRIFQLM